MDQRTLQRAQVVLVEAWTAVAESVRQTLFFSPPPSGRNEAQATRTSLAFTARQAAFEALPAPQASNLTLLEAMVTITQTTATDEYFRSYGMLSRDEPDLYFEAMGHPYASEADIQAYRHHRILEDVLVDQAVDLAMAMPPAIVPRYMDVILTPTGVIVQGFTPDEPHPRGRPARLGQE